MKTIMLTLAATTVLAVSGIGANQASAMSLGQPAVAQTDQVVPIEKVGRRGGRGFRGGGRGFRGGRHFGRGHFKGHRGRGHRRWRHRHGFGVYLPAYAGHYYGAGCKSLRRKWIRTGSRVWHRRYLACIRAY